MSDPETRYGAVLDFRPGQPLERVLGTYQGRETGPLLVVTAGLHGNEPAGLIACRRVLRDLATSQPKLRGRFVALSGNRPALAKNVRSLDRDLNRMWGKDELATARSAQRAALTPEQAELVDLADVLQHELVRAQGPVTLLDLHSTSGAGPPFTILAHPDKSRELARALDVPVLLGLERILGGTLLEWMTSMGHHAVVLEGGQNVSPATIDNHESAIWVFLAAAGMIDAASGERLAAHKLRLHASAGELPRLLEICYRHELQPGERFQMVPGWNNFSPVESGALLAHAGDNLELEVRAPQSATMIMPRYQGQGLDGFFLAKQVG